MINQLILGARITPVQIAIIIVSLLLVASCFFLLKYTKIGQAMRAVANNAELASVSGIDSDRVILSAFALGSAIAGVAGILVAFDVDMTPTMGMNALMMGVVAVIIGGVGSIPGIALGALLLGMLVGVWKISSQWQDAIATFAFHVITFSVMNNWVSFTGGPMGLPGIPQPTILGWKITTHYDFLFCYFSSLHYHSMDISQDCHISFWPCAQGHP